MLEEVKDTILIIFSDNSLGGTSRSALSAAKAWKKHGLSVVFFSNKLINEKRSESLRRLGEILYSSSHIYWKRIRCVHFHYSNYSSLQLALISELVGSINIDVAPPLICNNIFSSDDSILGKKWPGKWTSSVLGIWSLAQYKFNTAFSGRVPFILPNAQDIDFFTIPTPELKENAKKELDVLSCPVILRIGSPHMGKWSWSYLKLIDEANKCGVKFIAVSPPNELSKEMKKRKNYIELPATSDDDLLKKYYWAADVFALDAARGESFGNVILESLLCGLPVTYCAKEFRDNTPWEFSKLYGFSYCSNEMKFIKITLQTAIDRFYNRADQMFFDKQIMNNYGINEFADKLLIVLNKLECYEGEGYLSSDKNIFTLMPKLKLAKVFFTHNPIVKCIKLLKLKLVRN